MLGFQQIAYPRQIIMLHLIGLLCHHCCAGVLPVLCVCCAGVSGDGMMQVEGA